MTELVSEDAFRMFLTAMVGGIGAWLVVFELRNLARLRGKPASPEKSDKQFGYAIGIVIALIALIGTARFNHLI